jgi:nucleotide-binding universal stress UspA family protein
MSPGIVVGTDFSAGSGLAVEEGRQLSRSLGVELVVVHVAASAGAETPDPSTSLEREWLRSANLDPDALVRRQGVPAVELARLARDLKAVLIVLGTHGASGYQPVALGATASRLALLAPCPVVLVGPRGRGGGPEPQVPRRSQRVSGSEGRPSEPLARQFPGTVPETQE